MSWSDYTRAKHFGNGIYLPYSQFISEIAIDLDNLLLPYTDLSTYISFLPERDIVLIEGDKISVIVLSSIKYRHLPLFQTNKWNEVFKVAESFFLDKFPCSSSTAVVLEDNSLSNYFIKSYSMISPTIFIFPSLFMTKRDSEEEELKKRVTFTIANYLLDLEIKNYEEIREMLKNTEIFLSHKSVDKSLVREVAATLASIGYKPWLDEDKMKAGANVVA